MTLLSNPDRLSGKHGVARFTQNLPMLCLVAPCLFGALLLGRHVWAAYHWRAAKAALARWDLAQAREHLKSCLKVRNDPELQFLAARTARRAGDCEVAAEHLRRYARRDGITPAIVLEQLLLHAQRGELAADDENRLWSLVHQGHPDSLLVLEAMAQGYIYTYRLTNALDCLQRWLERQPDAIPALRWRAQVCQSLHRDQQALDDYRRAIALDPTSDTARLQLAILLAFSGRADQATEHFERLWQQGARNPQVLLGLARCRDAQGRTKEAGQLLDALLHTHPNDIPALRERAKLALHLGQDEEAEDRLRKCLAMDPSDQEATYLLVLCLERRGNEQEAQAFRRRLEQIDADLQRLEALNRAVGQAPQNAALRYEAALICLRHGQEQEGLRWLKGALQVDPQYRPAQQMLAKQYRIPE